MSSTKSSGLDYVKDRCVNAYRMVRAGKFRLVFESVYIELVHRVHVIKALRTRLQVPDSQVPDSAYIDMRKVLPPSYRPTTAQPPLAVPLLADPKAIAGDIRQILSTILIEGGVGP